MYTTSTNQHWTVISGDKVFRVKATTEQKVRAAFKTARLPITGLHKDGES